MESELTNKYKNWAKNLTLWLVIFCLLIGGFYLNRSGAPELVMRGEITSCASVLGGRSGVVEYAIVTLKDGSQVKIYSESCCKGQAIMVAKKHGVLFFNTIYTRANA